MTFEYTEEAKKEFQKLDTQTQERDEICIILCIDIGKRDKIYQ